MAQDGQGAPVQEYGGLRIHEFPTTTILGNLEGSRATVGHLRIAITSTAALMVGIIHLVAYSL
jgi:hypothetical protein